MSHVEVNTLTDLLTQRVPNIEEQILPTCVLASLNPQTAIFQQTLMMNVFQKLFL